MRITLITLFCVIMLLSLPFYSYVRAEVVEETRVLYIENADVVDYASILNIANGTNNQYSNYEKLVIPFIENTSISGGFSGSFMPPSKFQLNTATGSAENNHLILASFVEFDQKNLLSGSSVSWWRCPYYYNWSVPSSRSWDLDMSIYHVDLPRKVNISWELATGSNNYPAVPTNSAHPSLIYQNSYSDCGNTQNDDQFAMDHTGVNAITIPANDTLVNPDLPLNLDSFSPDYNPYLYNVSLDFSFTWFNVSAPIYPNETYMVVWDITDLAMGVNDAGSCWITATDIGDNEIVRSLISWNSQIIYELPIDLDSSVIFQYGMGAGITGEKLSYNDPQVVDHTGLFTNPSFETSTFSFNDDFHATYYSSSVSNSLWAEVSGDTDLEQAYINVSRTGDLVWGSSGIDYTKAGDWGELYYNILSPAMATEGTTFRFDFTMYDATFTYSASDVYIGSSATFGIFDSTAEHGRVTIQRLKRIQPSGQTFENRLYWVDTTWNGGTGGQQWVDLPESLPNNLILEMVMHTSGYNVIYLYQADAPNEVYFSKIITNAYRSGSAFHPTINGVMVAGAVYCAGYNSFVLDGYSSSLKHNVITIKGISGVERTNNLNGWTLGTTNSIPSKQELYDGYETIVPENDLPPSPTNTKCFSFIDELNAINGGIIEQTSSATSISSKNVYASMYVRLFLNDTGADVSNSYLRITIGGRMGTTWIYDDSIIRLWDGGWHKVSTPYLYGTFNMLYVSVSVQFQAQSYADPKQVFFDNLEVKSMSAGANLHHRFNHEVDQNEWDSNNYYTFMMPFRQAVDVDHAPVFVFRFKNDAGTTLDTFVTTATDFVGDFIIYSIKTSEIDSGSTWVQIDLYNFGTDSYIFLYDKNNDFVINSKTEYKYNYIALLNSADTILEETFFSPYYSLRTTEGQWINSDSYFTTSYFYYVVVRFVEFNDNDPQVISIRYDNVDVQDVEFYREQLKACGEVYTAEEWLIYLDIRNRPSFADRIWDGLCDFAQWLIDSGLGIFLSPIGFMIFQVLEFLTPYLESGLNLLIDVIQFMASIIVYVFGTWTMWKFVGMWILIGEGRTEEGIQLADDTSRKVINKVKSGIQAGVGVIGKIFTGGAI